MSSVKMRPTFLLDSEFGERETMLCIRQAFSNDQAPTGADTNEALRFNCRFTDHHAMISIQENARHFWSPFMNLEVRGESEASTIRGRFSPHPSIWTGFMFAYLAIGVLAFFAIMFGVSQQLAGSTPWAYYCVPVALVVAALLWFASLAGQRLAYEEMHAMKSKLEACISQKG